MMDTAMEEKRQWRRKEEGREKKGGKLRKKKDRGRGRSERGSTGNVDSPRGLPVLPRRFMHPKLTTSLTLAKALSFVPFHCHLMLSYSDTLSLLDIKQQPWPLLKIVCYKLNLSVTVATHFLLPTRDFFQVNNSF